MVENNQKVTPSPQVVCREEFDDWALLFDPDTGHAFGMNPTSVFVWKHLDGKNTVSDIINKLKESCEGVPAEAEQHVKDFINDLLEKGLAAIN